MEELGRKSVGEFKESAKFPLVVVLDNVRSMHNVGSVFRTADAFLIGGILLCGYTPRPPHRDIQKTALGASETVDWQYFETTLHAVDQLKAEGYRIFAVEQVEKSIPLQEFSLNNSGKVAVIFGNEVSGVDAEVLKQCDGSIEIPQFGMKHSLNISVAAGIVLWEIAGRVSR
jgi:23S rRNA (guanosine2251-2'-O)-methyltransferase